MVFRVSGLAQDSPPNRASAPAWNSRASVGPSAALEWDRRTAAWFSRRVSGSSRALEIQRGRPCRILRPRYANRRRRKGSRTPRMPSRASGFEFLGRGLVPEGASEDIERSVLDFRGHSADFVPLSLDIRLAPKLRGTAVDAEAGSGSTSGPLASARLPSVSLPA